MPILRESPGLLLEEGELSPRYPLKIFSKSEHRGERIRLHYHSSFEVNLFSAAVGTVFFEESRYALSKNKLILIPPRVLHAYRIEPDAAASVQVVHFALPYLERFINLEEIERALQRLPRSFDSEALRQLLNRHQPGLHNPFTTLELLFAILKTVPERSEAAAPQATSCLFDLVTYVEEHYADSISLDTAAEIAGCSRSTLTRLFREHTGAGFHAFLTAVRVDRACRMLQTGAAVSRTAQDCGFYDASHFVRAFKAHTGSTPSGYRTEYAPVSGIRKDQRV